MRELRTCIRAAAVRAEGSQIFESHLVIQPYIPEPPRRASAPPAAVVEDLGPASPRSVEQAIRLDFDIPGDPDLPQALHRTKMQVISMFLAWAEEQASSRKDQAMLLNVSLRTLHNYLRMVEEEQEGRSP